MEYLYILQQYVGYFEFSGIVVTHRFQDDTKLEAPLLLKIGMNRNPDDHIHFFEQLWLERMNTFLDGQQRKDQTGFKSRVVIEIFEYVFTIFI